MTEKKIVSMGVEEAIQRLYDELSVVKSVALANLSLHKMTLQAMVDLDLIQLENLKQALTEMADRELEGSTESEILLSMTNGFVRQGESSKEDERSTPTLRLVTNEDGQG